MPVGYNSAVGTQPSRKPVFPPAIAPYIDMGAYLLDARAPAATLYLDKLLTGRELLVLTRADQAEPRITKRWQEYFTAAGYKCIVVDSIKGTGYPQILDYLADLLQRKQAVADRRGIKHVVLRIAALGVPNVGKSTFLNHLMGRHRFKTGDKPGITRGHQWVRLFADVEVLDTPGVLRDPQALNRRKTIWMLLNLFPYDSPLREESIELLRIKLTAQGWKKLQRYYKIADDHFHRDDWMQLLESIAAVQGKRMEDEDALDRVAHRLLRDFQVGRFGRLSLERPGVDEITSPLFNFPPE